MSIDDRVLQRIDEILGIQVDGLGGYGPVNEALQGTLTLLNVVHGPGSQQQANLLQAVDNVYSGKWAVHVAFPQYVWPVVVGTLQALKADIKAGLAGTIHRRAIGEVVADMLGLAKEALADGGDGGRNVAAVLAAASCEDVIRKMGATFAGVHDRRDLEKVLLALKDAKILEGAPFTTGQGYLKFRNDALHADWSKLNSAVVGSCIAFVEALLTKHFG